MKKYLLMYMAGIILIALGVASPLAAQQPRAMVMDDLVGWNRIVDRAISNDGQWVFARMEPGRGDATLYVYNATGAEVASFTPAKKGEFSASGYLLVTKTTPLAVNDSLKLKKTKEDKMPVDGLLIFNLALKKEEAVDSIRSYKLAEGINRIAYQRGQKTDSTLYVRSLEKEGAAATFPSVSDYYFSKENGLLCFVSKGDSLGMKAGLYTYPASGGTPSLVWEGAGVFKQVAVDEKGKNLAFLYCPDKDSTRTDFALYLSEGNKPAQKIAARTGAFLPAQWVISENGKLEFTKQAKRLAFGIAPEPKQKDTTILPEYRPEVQVWNWDEKIQYTVQNYNRAEDLKKTYTVSYNLAAKKFLPLTSPEIPNLQTVEDDNVPVALLTTQVPYQIESMWEGSTRSDVYTINLETGEKQKVKEGTYARARLSPKGKYAYWYNPRDSSWYTYSIAEKKEYRLTTPATFAAWDEDNDVPANPGSHGAAGWTADDASLLLYDRFDVWQFNPKASAPINLTVTGRKDQTAYRRISLDKEETFIDLKQTQLLRGFNQTTKGYGYYSAKFSSPATPQTLLAGNYMLSVPIKAQKADTVIYTLESYTKYPDIQLSALTFKQPVQLTQGGLQQAPFIWGTAELTSWLSLDGKRLEGVIYKPANFDPSKKYPVIVNFYERNSETLHSYHNPEVGRSTIDYHFYNSNGYIIFNPDVVYDAGYPGESSFKCVMSGITSLIAKGYVNEKAIGVQGHSWGGYQDAYLATRTNLFAAIESGAPVVNMLSAYGGIRWGTGLNRSFQYEHGQSRIGGSIWEKPLLYLENSPLLNLDKVETPVLIMANDNDGHVPWYQGIEFFVGLKRLQKPTWLLNYMGEPHWPVKIANRIDFQTRMFQFFEHYLRQQPMPKWMSEGVPAVERDFDLGLGY